MSARVTAGAPRAQSAYTRRESTERLRQRLRGDDSLSPQRSHPAQRRRARERVCTIPALGFLLHSIRELAWARALRRDRDRKHLGYRDARHRQLFRDRVCGHARSGEGIYQYHSVLAARHVTRYEAVHLADPDADRDHRKADEALRAGDPFVRQHDLRARGIAGVDQPDLYVRYLDSRPTADCDGTRYIAAGTVRRISSGVHLHAPHECVHRFDSGERALMRSLLNSV